MTQREQPWSDDGPEHGRILVLTDNPIAQAIAGVDQALWDLAAKRAGVPVATMLGDAAPQSIPLYANINRAVTDRRPEGFAEVARRACADG